MTLPLFHCDDGTRGQNDVNGYVLGNMAETSYIWLVQLRDHLSKCFGILGNGHPKQKQYELGVNKNND